ncbi:helix-turn-helix transcriptional regulator [Bosea thiooxidans]
MQRFELDIAGLIEATQRNTLATGLDVLGPREAIIGSTDHAYRRLDSEVFLHTQSFRVVEPYIYRVMRRRFLSCQFILSGSYRMGLPNRMQHFRSATVRISGFAESETHVPADGRHVFGLCAFVRPEFLIDGFGLSISRIPVAYRTLFQTPERANLSLELPLTPAMWLGAEQLLNCRMTEPLRGVFQNAKTLELLCLLVAQLNALRPTARILGVSRQAREDQMVSAAEAIYKHEMHRPPSIDEMARRIGLNKNRLTDAFKARFGLTPGEYSRETRLQWAHQRLAEGFHSVTDVAATVGYDSHAAFTRAFRERYGYAPSAVRQVADAAGISD